MSFKNQTVVVTGAAGHLGSAVAEAFHDANAKVVLVDAEAEFLDNRFPKLDNHYVKAPINLLQRDAVFKTIAKIEDEHDADDDEVLIKKINNNN